MSPICGNCIYWQNGECEVKYEDNRTTSNHECDVVMEMFDFSFGGPTMFFAPENLKRKKNEKQ